MTRIECDALYATDIGPICTCGSTIYTYHATYLGESNIGVVCVCYGCHKRTSLTTTHASADPSNPFCGLYVSDIRSDHEVQS